MNPYKAYTRQLGGPKWLYVDVPNTRGERFLVISLWTSTAKKSSNTFVGGSKCVCVLFQKQRSAQMARPFSETMGKDQRPAFSGFKGETKRKAAKFGRTKGLTAHFRVAVFRYAGMSSASRPKLPPFRAALGFPPRLSGHHRALTSVQPMDAGLAICAQHLHIESTKNNNT